MSNELKITPETKMSSEAVVNLSFKSFILCGIFFLSMVVMELLIEDLFIMYRSNFTTTLASLVTLSQLFGCFFIPLLRSSFKFNLPPNRKIFVSYILLAVLIYMATAMATEALNYVNYPTKVIFKSAKLIPVMIVSTIIHKKVYRIPQYFTALLLCVGAICFGYDSSRSASKENKIGGIILLVFAVSGDAIVPNFQQYLMGQLDVSVDDVMINTNIIGFIVLFLYLVLTSNIQALLSNPDLNITFLLKLAGVGLSLGCGVLSYTFLIKEAGSVTAIAVSTLRKIVTILLSYLFFPKPFTTIQAIGTVAVIGGILMESFKDHRKK